MVESSPIVEGDVESVGAVWTDPDRSAGWNERKEYARLNGPSVPGSSIDSTQRGRRRRGWLGRDGSPPTQQQVADTARADRMMMASKVIATLEAAAWCIAGPTPSTPGPSA